LKFLTQFTFKSEIKKACEEKISEKLLLSLHSWNYITTSPHFLSKIYITYTKSYLGKSKHPVAHRLDHPISGQMLFASQSVLYFQVISEPLIQQQNEEKGILWSWLWHNAGEKEELFSEM